MNWSDKKQIMERYTSLAEGVARSISHDEIAIVEVPNPIEALAEPELAGVDEWVEVEDAHGRKYIDCWGTSDDGEEFRIYIYAAK